MTRGRSAKVCGWFGRAILLVLVVEINQYVAMRAIRRQQDQHDEIGNQQRRVKSVGVIQALESLIEKMLADVLPDSLRGDEGGESAKRDGDTVQLRKSLSESRRAQSETSIVRERLTKSGERAVVGWEPMLPILGLVV